MITQIDIRRSILKGQIVQYGFFSNVKEIIFSAFVISAFIFILLMEFHRSNFSILSVPAIPYFTGLVLLLILLYLNTKFTTRLKKFVIVKGVEIETNRNIIIEIIKSKKWKILLSRENLIIVRTTPALSVNWQLTVILSDSNILINSMHLGTHDIISPMFYIGNKKEVKYLKTEIENRIINTA